MKNKKSFFFSFVPLLTATAVQLIAAIFLIGVSLLYAFTILPIFNCGSLSMSDLTNYWTSNDFMTGIMIIYSIIIIFAFSIWYYSSFHGELLPNKNKTYHPYKVIGVIMLVPGTQILSGYLVALLSTAFPKWLEDYEKLLESAGLDENITILMLIYSVLLAPVAEELIFRGVTLSCAKKALPFWAANILQAALFGAYHMNLMQGCYAFALGLVLGYVCQKGKSIYYAILLHVLFNLWGTVIASYLNINESIFAVTIWFLASMILLYVGTFLFTKGNRIVSNHME